MARTALTILDIGEKMPLNELLSHKVITGVMNECKFGNYFIQQLNE